MCIVCFVNVLFISGVSLFNLQRYVKESKINVINIPFFTNHGLFLQKNTDFVFEASLFLILLCKFATA